MGQEELTKRTRRTVSVMILPRGCFLSDSSHTCNLTSRGRISVRPDESHISDPPLSDPPLGATSDPPFFAGVTPPRVTYSTPEYF